MFTISMKTCSSCNKEYREEYFSYKIKSNQTRQSQCKFCTRIRIRNHYDKNREYYLLKARKRNLGVRSEVQEYVAKYLMLHPCVDCREKDILVLEFDHKGNKFKDVSEMVSGYYSLDKVINEISKCEVRCANCHRRKTNLQFGWNRSKLPL